jgi:uncharacterized membrane protein
VLEHAVHARDADVRDPGRADAGCLHYAHLYYSDEAGGDHAGLDFPGKRREPDYWDFVYFSYTLGIALQTSDVCITSTRIRRLVVLHCIGAFIYNLGVLALAVNVLAG